MDKKSPSTKTFLIDLIIIQLVWLQSLQRSANYFHKPKTFVRNREIHELLSTSMWKILGGIRFLTIILLLKDNDSS